MDPHSHLASARAYLLDLQERLCAALAAVEPGGAGFEREDVADERGGSARLLRLAGGAIFERAVVHFSHARATLMSGRRPELAGCGYEAVSLSAILHPRNPYVPIAHANLRFFLARPAGAETVWWFGGGFDLTPVYGFVEDAVHWHRTARVACAPFGEELYPRFKRACDEYFYLPHRGETRGVGGLFFEDLAEPDFAGAFAFVRSVGEHFLPAYLPILERRKSLAWGERERAFQLFRRGRYVELNLLYDRGTRHGLESGVRAERVLASLPPLAAWPEPFTPDPGSPEARLAEDFLRPRDWLGENPER